MCARYHWEMSEEIIVKKKRAQSYLLKQLKYCSLSAWAVAHSTFQQANGKSEVSQLCREILKRYDRSDIGDVSRIGVDVSTMCKQYMPDFQNKHITNELNCPHPGIT